MKQEMLRFSRWEGGHTSLLMVCLRKCGLVTEKGETEGTNPENVGAEES